MADQESPSGSEPVINIVLVGHTGNGKSSTGNMVLGQKMFKAKKEVLGVTMKCEMFRAATNDGPIINVIDTPGLFDLIVSADYLSKEIINCLSMAKEGIHAVLFVLSLKCRLSQGEESTLNSFQRIFESKILDYFIVVFTGGDNLEEGERTLDDYLNAGCPEFLTRVLRLCGGRKVLFDNKTTDKEKKAKQVNELLAHVADVGKQTGGIPYTDNMHRKIKEENDKLREREREIESKNLAEADLAVMKEKVRMENEKTMNMMAQMVENALKLSAAAHEKEMRQLKETLQQSQEIQQRQQRLQLQPLLPDRLPGINLECNIM